MIKFEDERAFPVTMEDGRGASMTNLGMTLRDYFAGKATDADIEFHRKPAKDPVDGMVRYSKSREQARYAFADAMIAERKS
jgi:hypothetical protein